MYLAEYDINGTPWIQAAASLTYPKPRNDDRTRRWWDRFHTLLRNLDAVPEAGVSLRVALESAVEATCFAIAPRREADLIRRAVASFTQLGVVANGEIEFAPDRGSHDRLLDFPQYRCRIAFPSLTSDGSAWFAFDYRIADFLNEVLTEAHHLGHTIAYHVNVEPFSAELPWQREAARNTLRVSHLAGVPAAIEQRQRDLAEKLSQATHICEEIVGVSTPVAREWLLGVLRRRFRQAYGVHVDVEFSFEERGHEASLVTTRHMRAFDTVAIEELCGTVVTADERLHLIAWQPDDGVLELMPTAAVDVSSVETGAWSTTDLGEPYSGSEPFAFISYKHEDLAIVQRTVCELTSHGHRMWYDKGIPGGAEWDALIEERLQQSTVVLVFVSARAIASKYVRREVKYADFLNKPIISIRLETELPASHGMGMLLTQYQMLDAVNGLAPDALERALRFVRLV